MNNNNKILISLFFRLFFRINVYQTEEWHKEGQHLLSQVLSSQKEQGCRARGFLRGEEGGRGRAHTCRQRCPSWGCAAAGGYGSTGARPGHTARGSPCHRDGSDSSAPPGGSWCAPEMCRALGMSAHSFWPHTCKPWGKIQTRWGEADCSPAPWLLELSFIVVRVLSSQPVTRPHYLSLTCCVTWVYSGKLLRAWKYSKRMTSCPSSVTLE